MLLGKLQLMIMTHLTVKDLILSLIHFHDIWMPFQMTQPFGHLCRE